MAQQAPDAPSRHYLTQVGLAVAVRDAVRRLWPQLDYSDLRGSLPALNRDVYALIRQAAQSSAAMAARDYRQARITAGIRSQFTVPLADPPPVPQVEKKVHWAISDLWGSDSQAKAPEALTKLEGGATKLVLDVGRETTVQAVESDRQARAWARETRPNCCYWCAMLAGRGAVYRSAHAAGEDNTFHNNCHCAVVPVFGEYEPTAHARQWASEWPRVTAGLKGDDAVNAWRRHFEGRN